MEGTLTLAELPSRVADLRKERFGFLKPVEYVGKDRTGHTLWLCECSGCDGGTKIVMACHLTRGNTRSCGCLKSRTTRKKLPKKFLRNLTGIYYNIIARCTNPKTPGYERYGGRGISLYLPWLNSYEQFCMDVEAEIGPRPSMDYTIDRIDPDGNYEPGNIRWATAKQQANNKSKKS